MIKVVLIRHGMTAGNLEKRYIGRTDEPITGESCASLKEKAYPHADYIYVSPMLRCRQTAKVIYPGREYHVYSDLRECDFGRFESKNYIDLTGDSEYQAWIDSGGTLSFPGGESNEDFRNRCCDAFSLIMSRHITSVDVCNSACVATTADTTIAFIVHGGTIMSVLERFAAVTEPSDYELGRGYELGHGHEQSTAPKSSFYDWQVKNGNGYTAILNSSSKLELVVKLW